MIGRPEAVRREATKIEISSLHSRRRSGIRPSREIPISDSVSSQNIDSSASSTTTRSSMRTPGAIGNGRLPG